MCRTSRWLALAALSAALPFTAAADRGKPKPAPAASSPKDLGTWDCNGSPLSDEVIAPGEHAFVWRGECAGAEGFAAVIEPKPATLITREVYDAKTKRLVLRVDNRGTQPVRVKLHVFVGFA